MSEKPWLFRTYAGHSTAGASNALYRANLARGQTGLSVAWHTECGYRAVPDPPQARASGWRTISGSLHRAVRKRRLTSRAKWVLLT